MINNEFCFNYGSWGRMDLYMKVEFPINIEKEKEFLTEYSWRCEKPEVPFAIISNNVKDNKRFLKTSKAKQSISLNRGFLTDKKGNGPDEKKYIDWFTRGEKQTRYVLINTFGFFKDYRERQQVLEEIKKTGKATKLVQKIQTKGLDISNLSLSGPKFKLPTKNMIKFKIDGDLTVMDLINRNSQNTEKVKTLAKFIVGGSYQLRFIDYEE